MLTGWKTLIFNILAAVLTVVVGFNWDSALTAYPWAAPLIITLGNIALRFVTTTPVGTSDAAK